MNRMIEFAVATFDVIFPYFDMNVVIEQLMKIINDDMNDDRRMIIFVIGDGSNRLNSI